MQLHHIHRYLSGQAGVREQNELKSQLQSSERSREDFKAYRRIYQVRILPRYRFDSIAALQRFKKVLEDEDTPSYTPYKSELSHMPVREKSSASRLAVAAILLITAGISLYLFLPRNDMDKAQFVERTAESQVISTRAGEQKVFRLVDGSRIRLNAGSSITVPAKFGNGHREVFLEGEAFFEVTANHDAGFRVLTKEALTEVMGTHFSIRSWRDRQESVVAVERGVVAVSSSDDQVFGRTVLSEGTYARVEAGQPPSQVLSDATEAYLGWTRQRLVFIDTELRDVISQLELHFNVMITPSDTSVLHAPVNASYENESLEEILKYTSLTHGVHFEIIRSN